MLCSTWKKGAKVRLYQHYRHCVPRGICEKREAVSNIIAMWTMGNRGKLVQIPSPRGQ